MKHSSFLHTLYNICLVLIFVFATTVAHATAGVPDIISYQGRLTDQNGILLGGTGTTYHFKFSIWDSPTVGAGTRLWPISAPTATSLTVTDGVFDVNIGDTAGGYPDALTYDFQTNDTVYLQVEVSPTGSSYETLGPRPRITSSSTAINAKTLSGLPSTYFLDATNLANFDSRAIAAPLTGYTSAPGTITASDTILSAIQKLNGNIGGGGAVTSVFGRTGVVTAQSGDYTTDQVTEATNLYYTQARFDTAFGLKTTTNLSEGSNLYYTDARARAALSVSGGPLAYNNVSGVLSIDQANSGTDGYISSTDWNTFNNKQGAITTGTTAQYIRGDLSLGTFPTAVSSFTNDSGYLTANQTITLSGDISGSGTTAITATIGAGKVTNAMLAGSIASSKLVGSDIATVGTITSGTWQGTAIGDAYIASAATWNAKENALTFSGPLSRSVNTISIADASADGSTKGAATFTASDFNAASGVISIDYTNGQVASGSTKGFLTAADWTTFNNKGSGTVTSVSGTTNRIDSTGGATPVIDISALYAGQTSITTLGTITAGTWNGTAIANANLANSSLTIGSTTIALGATSTTLAGLTSVAATTFTGALTGVASGNELPLTFSTGLTRTTNTITTDLSTGVSGGQSVIGGTASGDDLALSSTSNATKGSILFGTSDYDEATNQLNITNSGQDTWLTATGDVNSFFQANLQNTNAGASASTDFVVTADNGTSTTHYADFGINSSGGGGAPFTTANEAYMYAIDDSINIGALGASSKIKFFTTGGLSPVQRMVIDEAGLVGINQAIPLAKLHVERDSIGATQNDSYGIMLKNATAAALNAQQWSPAITLVGQGWGTTGSASQEAKLRITNIPVQGSAATLPKFFVERASNGGAYSELFSVAQPAASSSVMLTLNGQNAMSLGGGSNIIHSSSANIGFYNQAGSISLASMSSVGVWALTPSSFTTATTLTAWSIAQTWNNASGVYSGISANITNTASNAASKLIDLKVGGNNMFSVVASTGFHIMGSNAGNIGIGPATLTSGAADATGPALRYLTASGSTANAYEHYFIGGNTRTPTANVGGFMRLTETFAPTSGTADYNMLTLFPTINQTGGSSGVTRGLYVNPTLTAAFDFRAIETASADFGNGAAGLVVQLGRNSNATNAGAGSINFLNNAGTNGYVWQDAAGNMRINTSAPTTANDTAGTVIGAQTSTRETKQDIEDYTTYADALQKIVDAPLHTFRYIKEVRGYGEDSPLAKTRIGFIADEVDPSFMVGNVIDQVSINGLLMASIKELNLNMQVLPILEDKSLASKIADFLRGIAESGTALVDNLKSKKVQTEELCVGDDTDQVCVTKEQLRTLIGGSGTPSNGGGGTPTPDPIVDTPPSGGDTVVPSDTPPTETTTSDEASVPDPTPVPDPVSESTVSADAAPSSDPAPAQ